MPCRTVLGRSSFSDAKSRNNESRPLFASLGWFLPSQTENDAGLVQGALRPLQRLADGGLSVLLVHHPRKKTSLPGRQARGSGMLCSTADVLLEMSPHDPAAPLDRRRRLEAFSRSEATPRQLLIALNAAGTDYLVLTLPDADAARDACWRPLQMVLEQAAHRLTRAAIEQQWPPDFPRPKEVTLWKGLTRAVETGWVRRAGSGYRGDPFRYWLPEMEEVWRQLYGRQADQLPDSRKEALFRQALERGELQWAEEE